MKKVSAVIIAAALALSLAACSKKAKETDGIPALDMTPSFTQEELREAVDFESAEFAAAEDGEVKVETGRVSEGPADSEAPPASVRTELAPDQVWSAGSTGDNVAGSGTGSFTLPEAVQMTDGSLGHLSIPKIGLTVPVYETDSEMEDMAHGVAHFKETSCWDGNVGLAGHNQGVNTYFGQIHTLASGDKITLTTALGSRIYSIVGSYEIDENDWSRLGRTEENTITLITCVNHNLSRRLCVQAVETAQ